MEFYDLLHYETEMVSDKFVFETDASKLHQMINDVPALVSNRSRMNLVREENVAPSPALRLQMTGERAVTDTRGVEIVSIREIRG